MIYSRLLYHFSYTVTKKLSREFTREMAVKNEDKAIKPGKWPRLATTVVSGIEMSKNVYLSAGQVTMSD